MTVAALKDDLMNDNEHPSDLLIAMGYNVVGVTCGLTKQPDLTSMPHATLESWRALKMPGGNVHLVGYCLERAEGRLSTPVVSVDASTRTCQTASGRAYRLLGEHGYDGDAEYVLARFMAHHGIEKTLDVSDELFVSVSDPGDK